MIASRSRTLIVVRVTPDVGRSSRETVPSLGHSREFQSSRVRFSGLWLWWVGQFFHAGFESI